MSDENLNTTTPELSLANHVIVHLYNYIRVAQDQLHEISSIHSTEKPISLLGMTHGTIQTQYNLQCRMATEPSLRDPSTIRYVVKDPRYASRCVDLLRTIVENVNGTCRRVECSAPKSGITPLFALSVTSPPFVGVRTVNITWEFVTSSAKTCPRDTDEITYVMDPATFLDNQYVKVRDAHQTLSEASYRVEKVRAIAEVLREQPPIKTFVSAVKAIVAERIPERQRLKCIEECNELATAIAHHAEGKVSADEVIEEVCDVVFTSLQVAFSLGHSPTDILTLATKKLAAVLPGLFHTTPDDPDEIGVVDDE